MTAQTENCVVYGSRMMGPTSLSLSVFRWHTSSVRHARWIRSERWPSRLCSKPTPPDASVKVTIFWTTSHPSYPPTPTTYHQPGDPGSPTSTQHGRHHRCRYMYCVLFCCRSHVVYPTRHPDGMVCNRQGDTGQLIVFNSDLDGSSSSLRMA